VVLDPWYSILLYFRLFALALIADYSVDLLRLSAHNRSHLQSTRLLLINEGMETAFGIFTCTGILLFLERVGLNTIFQELLPDL
jgi:hypothetical protein